MNISAVTQTAPIIPANQIAPQPPAPAAEQERGQNPQIQGPESASDAIRTGVAPPNQGMDMAPGAEQNDQEANQLMSEMAAVTGIGQNFDMMA